MIFCHGVHPPFQQQNIFCGIFIIFAPFMFESWLHPWLDRAKYNDRMLGLGREKYSPAKQNHLHRLNTVLECITLYQVITTMARYKENPPSPNLQSCDFYCECKAISIEITQVSTTDQLLWSRRGKFATDQSLEASIQIKILPTTQHATLETQFERKETSLQIQNTSSRSH